MQIDRRSFLASGPLIVAAASVAGAQVAPPIPYGAVPSKNQVLWSEVEFYNFLHFTVNTFTDQEWGNGDESPSIFNPAAFDADAIVDTLKSAGSKGVILTCKHHDGFCLWPTKTTAHSIRRSPFRNGNGDMVKEISEAANRHGLKFGVYLSPWDRNQASYGSPEYIQIYRRQMRELLSNYGPIFEIWHDGANGGKGYYGGANETRTIDKLHYYDWGNTWKLERELQPHAAIFSDVGPDVRWVGNEKGIAGDTCWATYTPRSPSGGPGSPGDVIEEDLTSGTRNGNCWMPPECDVSIRPGWFWHAAENDKVKTPQGLMKLYLASVGKGGSFLLNVPPDRRGLIHEKDASSLRQYGHDFRRVFEKNLASEAIVSASSTRGNDPAYKPENVTDGSRSTYWATADGVTNPAVTIQFREPVTFNLVRLREYIQLGQRVDQFEIDTSNGDDWTLFERGTSIGLCKIVRSQASVTASQIRIRFTKLSACPALSEVGVYRYEG